MSSSVPNPTGQINIFTLAADGSPRLLDLLRADPQLARSQDSTGYSLAHALASYDHLDLLRQVAREFGGSGSSSGSGTDNSSNGGGDGNTAAGWASLQDEDGETALFVVESVAAAQCLVDELGVDWRARNLAGETAEEKIRAEGDYVTVADFLAEVRKRAEEKEGGSSGGDGDGDGDGGVISGHPPPLPPGVKVELGAMTDEQAGELEPDPEFRRRIEELAARDDFQGEEGQAQLKQIVQDALRGVGSDDRDVRQRTA